MVQNDALRIGFRNKSYPLFVCPSSPLPVMNPYLPDPHRIPPIEAGTLPTKDYSGCTGSVVGKPKLVLFDYNDDPALGAINLRPEARAFSGLLPEFIETQPQNNKKEYRLDAYDKCRMEPRSFSIQGRKNGGVKPKEVKDGTSKTFLIVETAGFLRDAQGNRYPLGGPADPALEREIHNKRNLITASCCPDYQNFAQYGVVTIGTPVGSQDLAAHEAFGGGQRHFGGLRGILSGHPDSGMVAMGDASVHLLTSELDTKILYRLADRADEQPVEFPSP